MQTDFCIEAVDEAIHRHDTPDIFNTDQDSPFTSGTFTGSLKRHNICIGVDGLDVWRDNVLGAAVEIREMRRGLPQGLQHGFGDRSVDRQILRVLHMPPTALES